jgi:predicted transcriptional regulator
MEDISAQTYDEATGLPANESEDQRIARVRHEATLIAQAEAEIDAGLCYDVDEVEAWLDLLEINPNAELPAPEPSKR